MTQQQLAANDQRAFVAEWDAIVAVLRAMNGMEPMDQIRTLGAALAVVLAEPSLRSLSHD